MQIKAPRFAHRYMTYWTIKQSLGDRTFYLLHCNVLAGHIHPHESTFQIPVEIASTTGKGLRKNRLLVLYVVITFRTVLEAAVNNG